MWNLGQYIPSKPKNPRSRDGSVLDVGSQEREQIKTPPALLMDASTIKCIVEAANGVESQEQEKLANSLMKVVETLHSTIEGEHKKWVRDTEEELEEEGKVLLDNVTFTLMTFMTSLTGRLESK